MDMSSDITSNHTATLGRKRREDDGDKALVLIHETTEWISGLLGERKDDGTSEGRRVMSPATEASLRLLLEKYTKAAEADPATRERLTRDIALETIRKEVARRLQVDEKYLEARTKLESLMKDAWYLRYSDYHATNLAALRGEARDMVKKAKLAAAAAKMRSDKEAKEFGKKTAPKGHGGDSSSTPAPPPLTDEEKALHHFVSTRWIELDKLFDLEEQRAKRAKRNPSDPSVSTPLSDLLLSLVCIVSNTAYKGTRASMKLYAARNEVAHTHIDELARTKQWLKLADRIVEDLYALETEKLITKEQRAATKAAIWYKIGLHFEVFDLDEDYFTVSAMKAWPLDDKGKALRTSVRPASTWRVEPVDLDEEGSVGSVDTVVHHLVVDIEAEAETEAAAGTSSSQGGS
ncbi:hypothetical protein B0T25DRAFT_627841 [Lasiosphaeria hispida]|uniref:Uncharacterized protein n=1 Tax=Lasiosphaeria hispida TaxID=260671 RepID=A0AAJ0MKH6_9PEZI|nr:hypothetical protein B0T25DRAFT_627841 [Lasiosphaeria hispida]